MRVREIIRKAGGAARVAKAIGISSQAVSQWAVVPADHCATIERLSGGVVLCQDLRPDLGWQRDPQTNAVTGYVVPVAPATDHQEAA